MAPDPNDLLPWELAALRQTLTHIHHHGGCDLARTFAVTGWATRAIRGTLDGSFIPQRPLLRALAANLGVTEADVLGRDPSRLTLPTPKPTTPEGGA